MKFIIGLGNPEPEYTSTRHNIGFEVVKAVAKRHHIDVSRDLHFSLLGRGRIGGHEVTLVLPQTFMNLSGKAVGELFRHEATSAADLLVVCDDIHLELGKIRMRRQGSSGGQKGLESIIKTIGTDAFARLRVGIATDVPKGDISGYVLSPFKRKEHRNAKHAIELAADAACCAIEEGLEKAMTRFNKARAGTS
jgi:PTH1 family peptidyl-tRNA hydrolase